MLARTPVRLAFATALCARALCAQSVTANPQAQRLTGRSSVQLAPLVIENVAVIAMDGAAEANRVRRGMNVMIDSGRVRAVGAAREVKIPAGATRIDGTGRYLIPGLRDMHIHMNGQNGDRSMRWMIAFGVTGARVMAGSPAVLQFRERIERGELRGPDLYVAGPILEGVAPAGFEEVIAMGGKVVVHDSVEAARAVREQAAAGYDFVKIYNNLSASAYHGIVVEAKRLGIPVAGHVPLSVGLGGALSAHQVSIEHLRAYEGWLAPADAPQQSGPDLRSRMLLWEYADASRIREAAERTRDAGVWNVPTLATRLLFESDSDAAAYIRAEGASAEQVSRFFAQRRAMPFMSNFTQADYAAAKAGFGAQDSLVRALVGVGAGVMAGTDMGPFGQSLHRELELLVAAGLTPYQALESATRSPAKFLGLTDGSGTIAGGAPADLVLLDGNPLDNIANTRRIRGVVRRGVWIGRAALDSLRADMAIAMAPRPPEPATVHAAGRRRVETADQLPRHSYPVPAGGARAFLDSARFAALARQLESDLRADLAAYDIQDRATLKSYYRGLSNLALLRADYAAAVAYQDSIRAIEDKPGLKLTAGIVERALAAAAGPSSMTLDTLRFRTELRREIEGLSYAQAQAELAAMLARGRYVQNKSAKLVLETRLARIDEGGSASIPRDIAEGLVDARVRIDRIESIEPVLIDELARTIAAHSALKPDIWAARDVSLDGRAGLTCVVIGIWDSGTDVSLYPQQLFTNPGEVPDNGKDDDGNGYVDDVHGIAHDLDGHRAVGLLKPTSLTAAELTEIRDFLKGQDDVRAGLHTPEGEAVRRKLAAITAADMRSFQEKLGEYTAYTHGTHVAGVAVRGNPAARMLVARLGSHHGNEDFKRPPRAPTLEHARAYAQEMRETIAYFRQHGVRIVNMSWGFRPDAYESTLAAANVGTPEERRQLARQIYDVGATALHEAMAGAPEILFVAAAGNDDADNRFLEAAPQTFDLPNLITVGAVDQAGDETNFTSYGKLDVYANGFRVLAKVPGGPEVPAGGTSNAAPQVVNLAAKLLAVKPQLTMAELRGTIIESADEKTVGPGKKIKLLNPRAAFDLIVK